MKSARSTESLHALEVPTRVVSLLVPSTCVAEVVSRSTYVSVPLSPDWVLGVMSWRSRPVPVISLEPLIDPGSVQSGIQNSDGTGAQRRGSKIVIFYPLPGRNPWEFFGIVTSAEPQSRVIDSGEGSVVAAVPGNKIIAMTIQVGDAALAIPDLDALAALLYP